jgi:hypothetical protein
MESKSARPKVVAQTKITPIVILDQRVDFAGAQLIVKSTGDQQLPSLKEFILWLSIDANFQHAQGSNYWLREKSKLKISEHCKIDYKNGSIKPVSKEEWEKLPEGHRAWASPGKRAIQLMVGRSFEDGLVIHANYYPSNLAQVALVELKSKKHKNQNPQIANLLRRVDNLEEQLKNVNKINRTQAKEIQKLQSFSRILR